MTLALVVNLIATQVGWSTMRENIPEPHRFPLSDLV
jgi:hypothetical protein